MLPNSPNMLSSLTHTTHTEHSAPHAESSGGNSDDDDAVSFGGENSDADDALPPGGDAAREGQEPNCEISEKFNFSEFFTLATRVLDGDATSMASLISLKRRWEEQFKKRRNAQDDTHVPNPTFLKPVAGRTGTPFPRVSFLPRRNVLSGMATPPMSDLEVPTHSAGGIQRSILETRGFSSSSSSAQTSFSFHQKKFRFLGILIFRFNWMGVPSGAFLQSTRKNLHFVPPSTQNGEIVIRPTREVVENGSKKWYATAVGYFLGKRPYFPQLESFVRSNWNGLQFVSATSSGFYFFRFRSRAAMEEIIEGGPWLFQGQPIVLQFWEQGMTLRQRKHSQIPVWIRLKHLPMEYWTDEGLSTVASGVGTPLYTDGITKECSRLDYAREDPKRVDVEYEWLPQRCKQCCSLGHIASACPDNMKKKIAPPITIFVKKHLQSESEALNGQRMDIWVSTKQGPVIRGPMIRVASWNVRGLNGVDHQRAVEQLRIRLNFLHNWSWFEDYSGPAGRIWLAWFPLEVNVEILRVEPQLIHCRAFNKRTHTKCLISVLYGDYDLIPRRDLWGVLRTLSAGILEEPCEGARSLWKRLDRMLVNEAWLEAWPDSSYICALPSTSDHSPLVLTGTHRDAEHAVFRFDNYLTRQPGFLELVSNIWRHRIVGTAMYEVVCKLKALKADFEDSDNGKET
ncbi:hypothetical protein Sango_3068300 [Sesamum angolense]|uniref:DUF4283 domain-containing protein n=1 Tax=Sesamum angolense TaxID=2727404 RepID=A0AAE1TB71_9LAMI|nr:hypothetical protein Sango_3068300 [Sesamum angolense]